MGRERTSLAKKALRATRAVRTPHDGCQDSLRQESGVSRRTDVSKEDARVEGGDGQADRLARLESARGGEHVCVAGRRQLGVCAGPSSALTHCWRLERVLRRQYELPVVDPACGKGAISSTSTLLPSTRYRTLEIASRSSDRKVPGEEVILRYGGVSQSERGEERRTHFERSCRVVRARIVC